MTAAPLDERLIDAVRGEDRWSPRMLRLTAELPVVCDLTTDTAGTIALGGEPSSAIVRRLASFCRDVQDLPPERVSLHWQSVVTILLGFGVVADELTETESVQEAVR